jgi:hypothetical protein
MLLAALCVWVADAAEQARISANITYRIPEGVYVNAGSESGLLEDGSGTMVLDDGMVLRFEVLSVSRSSALLRLTGAGSQLVGSLIDRRVDLVFERKDDDQPATVTAAASARLNEEPFVPLLAPPKAARDISPAKNISRGRIGIRQTVQGGTENNQNYAVTRLDTSGSIDRLFGSDWSFIWSGNLRYRTGDGYQDFFAFDKVEPLIYSAYVQVPLSGEGFTRLGRFLPLELPAIGYIDGGQLEVDTGTQWSFGAVAGLKPNAVDLAFSEEQPTVSAYATFEAGQLGSAYFSGTAGVLGSVYKGEMDRLAILFDQRAALGPKLNLLSSATFDLGIADTAHSQTQLTQLNLTASSRWASWLTLRAGANHWQRLDTQAERDQFPYIIDDILFDNGYWRYWVGASHNLPWKLNLNEEVAYTVSEAVQDAVRWRVGLTRTGLFNWSSANVGATLYNLEGQNTEGLGWLLRAYLPFFDGRLALRPSASMRWLNSIVAEDSLSFSYISLYGDWMFYKKWSLSGGVTSTGGNFADSLLFDLGLRYSW